MASGRPLKIRNRQGARLELRVPVGAARSPFPPPTGEGPRPRTRAKVPPQILYPVTDAGFNAFEIGGPSSPAIEYTEQPLEGPASPNAAAIEINNQKLWEAIHREARMVGTGEPIENGWPLQVDTETANGNATFLFERADGGGEVAAALAFGAPHWHAPDSVDEIRAGLELLREQTRPEDRAGIDRALARLDQKKYDAWGPVTGGRINQPGYAMVPMGEGALNLSFACPHVWQPWDLADPTYKIVEGESYYSPAADGARLYATTRRATRVSVRLIPQLQRVIFQWLAVYIVGLFGTIIYYPQTRVITLRSGVFPNVFVPGAVPPGLSVDPSMSKRISNTLAYGLAIRDDVALGLGNIIFQFTGDRIQGRFAVYQRDLDREALCAVLDFHEQGARTRRLSVYRDMTIAREPERLRVDGLATQLVTPWIPDLFLGGRFPGSIGTGI